MVDHPAKPGKNRRLSDVVREVKIATAERDDVVVDMKEADRARLELLYEELAPVFAEVPADDDQFDFIISSGLQPRLWIDAIAHVQMGPDRRTYRFVRDTRLGRVVMAESGDMIKMGDSVTHYVAERLVERERFLATEQLHPESYGDSPHRSQETGKTAQQPPEADRRAPADQRRPVARQEPQRSASVSNGVWWFLFGALVGVVGLFLAFRETLGPLLGGL